jgi:hypothetical protein
VDNLQGSETEPVVKKYGLADFEVNGWYPASQFMAALNELTTQPNASSNMVAIGLAIGKIVPVPPGLENPTLEQILTHWNGMYQYIHRNGDVGTITCEKVTDKHFKTIHTDLYPDDFSYGIVYSYARRFLPPGTSFKVYFDTDVKRRDDGGEGATVIHVSWE